MRSIAVLVMAWTASLPALTQVRWFSDDFAGTDLKPVWKMTTGAWHLNNTVVSIETPEYDQLLAASYYVYGITPYSFEVVLRGARAGVYFSLDDTASKKLSHMVRFDEKSVLVGYFNGAGEYVATNIFEADRLLTEWCVLQVRVDPPKRRYEVFVNGKSIGIDTSLVFTSGYVGLQASDGLSEFQSVRVSGSKQQSRPKGARRGSDVALSHIQYVRSEGENLVIYNPERHVLQMLSSRGKFLRQKHVKTAPTALLSVTARGHTYSIRGDRIIYSDETGTALDTIAERLVAPAALLIDTTTTGHDSIIIYVADPGSNAIIALDNHGRFLKSFSASSVGGFTAPRGMDFYGRNEIVIADYDRLVFVNRSLEEVVPSVNPLSPTEARISWPRLPNTVPRIEYQADGGLWQKQSMPDSLSREINSATLTDLSPLTRYSFKITPPVKIIPADRRFSKEFRFTTPPADSSMMAYTRLPLLCMVYRTVSYRDTYPKERYPDVPDGRTITDSEIEYLKEATRFNEEFYFRNSSCKLLLDFDFIVVSDTLWLKDVGDQDPYWLSPNDRVTRDYEAAVSALGKAPADYGGLVCPYAWVNYPPRRTSALRDPSKADSISIRQAYGGGTNGVPAPWRYGKTTGYTSNPFQDRFSRQDWLITHEFHHQLDALLEASGYTEYYHADQPWKMPGRFGEDFDFNAHIIRNAGTDWWLNLKFGRLEQTRDTDHDGLPDDDPLLPFDEKRLNGSLHAIDTDRDGLTDLQEVMAGSSRGTRIDLEKTDEDTLADGIDPEPIYEFDPFVRRYKGTGILPYFATLRTEGLLCDIRCGWTSDSLHVAIRPTVANMSPPRFNVLLQIDASSDGWFHGFDNFQVRVQVTPDSLKAIDYYLRDCSSWTDPPRDRKDILSADVLQLRRLFATPALDEGSRETIGVEFTIPRYDQFGLALQPGKKISIRIGVQTTDDRWVWDELFERNYMMQVELVNEP